MSMRRAYFKRQRRLTAGQVLTLLALGLLTLFALSSGAMDIDWGGIFSGTDHGLSASQRVLVHIRLPRACSAILGGAALATAGLILQVLLNNPLASPSTLGISQGASFGAACGIWLLSSSADLSASSWVVTGLAFGGAMATTLLILALSLWRNCGRETIILAGVALSALFVAATTLLQYLADDTQLAAIVHWSFGDVGRAGWKDIRILAGVTSIGIAALWSQRRALNALMCGHDTATSLGLHVTRLRLGGVALVALMTATSVTILGVISFIGLVAPHLVRLLVGDSVVARLPLCALCGAILLLLADLTGRTLMAPLTFPAGVVTAFLGAPLFLALLLSREQP